MGRTKIGFIGAGHMANSLISGFVSSGMCGKHDICVFDIDEQKRSYFEGEGFRICESETDVVMCCEYVFLAVRPSDIKQALSSCAEAISLNNNVIVSMAAGISTEFIKRVVGKKCKVIRIVPNMAAQFGFSATALAYEMPITYSELSFVKELLESVGTVEIIPEDQMNDIISVNSSSPVFVYMMIRAMTEGAVNQGIDKETAQRMVIDMIRGAVTTVENSEDSIDALIKSVCSPNGTTQKSVDYLEKRGYEQIIGDAMLACSRRAATIEKEVENA